jgi:hypothetical protein
MGLVPSAPMRKRFPQSRLLRKNDSLTATIQNSILSDHHLIS